MYEYSFIQLIGGFIVWIFKRFKTNLKEEITKHQKRNLWLGTFFIIAAILFILITIALIA